MNTPAMFVESVLVASNAGRDRSRCSLSAGAHSDPVVMAQPSFGEANKPGHKRTAQKADEIGDKLHGSNFLEPRVRPLGFGASLAARRSEDSISLLLGDAFLAGDFLSDSLEAGVFLSHVPS